MNKNMIIRRRRRLAIFSVLCLIISILIIFDGLFTHEYIIEEPPFSSLAFWEDNRTLQTGRPLPTPITTTDKVNLTNFTLVIAACCRNVEKHLVGFQKNVRAIGSLFRKYRLYLGESDSTDGTLKFIKEWEKNDSDHVDVYTAGQQRWQFYFRKLFTILRIRDCHS
jgi:hypothetical protein